jgi:outer membrane protein TolC
MTKRGRLWQCDHEKPCYLVIAAAAANQELRAAMVRVEQARATARAARSELFPTLNAVESLESPTAATCED